LDQSLCVVVGCGGLGCPLLLYLAASGVGKITIIDHDHVSLSNLHRQILFTAQDINQPKAVIAAKKLQQWHPDTKIIPIVKRLDTAIAQQHCTQADLVIDGTDSFLSKYILDEIVDKLLIASVVGMKGYIAGFNQKHAYRQLFPCVPQKIHNCAETGVLGAVAGMLGSFMAIEAIKILIEIPSSIVNHCVQIDMTKLYFNKIKLNITSVDMHFPDFVFISAKDITDEIVIDIRESHEIKETEDKPHFNYIHIPLSRLNIDQIIQNPNFILKCQTGRRAEKLALQIALSYTSKQKEIKILI